MKRRPLKKSVSKRIFKKNTGVHAMNSMKPQMMRGGIRL